MLIDFIFLIKPQNTTSTLQAYTAIELDNAKTVIERCARNPVPAAGKGGHGQLIDEMTQSASTAALADFSARLRTEDIPIEVINRTVDLFVDWAGSALSGKGHRAIGILEDFAAAMGPGDGGCEILTNRRRTSPYFASMVNAGASHISEQDDVHNGSVFHPATIVFPAALAVAQDIGASGSRFLSACVAGYESGIRVGEFLGRSHYQVFHTTGTAGTLAASAACGNLLGLDEGEMLNAFGSAGTMSAGLWEFLRDAADSKQLHTARSSSNGVMAAWTAKRGFTGARRILEGPQGLAAGTSTDADPEKLTDGIGKRWCVLETSFKFHASCRHTHPAADALLKIIEENDLKADNIERIIAHVHQGAIDVLGPVTNPTTVHQAKFSMPATLGLIAVHRKAGLAEYQRFLADADARRFLDRVTMQIDDEVNRAYPKQWIGKVSLTTTDGRNLSARVYVPKGDPGNTLSRDEINDKVRTLATSGGALDAAETDLFFNRLWDIGRAECIRSLF